jgi:hypothetical protein
VRIKTLCLRYMRGFIHKSELIKKLRFNYPSRLSLLLLGLVLHLSSSSDAQVLDTMRYSLRQKPKLFFNFVPFNSYISSNVANFSGIRTGLNYNKRFKFGIGYFGLTNSSVVSDVTIEDDGLPYTTSGELNFHFFSLTAEYIFYHQDPWQFSFIPLQAGIGRASYDYIRRSENRRVATKGEMIFLIHPDFNAQYSVLNWLGLGTSLGYRVSLNGSKKVQEDFNSPTFSLTLKVFVDELYKMAFCDDAKSDH